MKSPYLEAAAMEWLRYKKQCHIVMRERGTRCGRPDVLAVTKDRYLIEVEAKRTMPDFRADKLKRHRTDPGLCHGVRQLYYIVPPGMVEKVMPELPPFAGLLTLHEKHCGYSGLPEIKLIRAARSRPGAGKITEARVWNLVKDMAANLVTAECRLRMNIQRTKDLNPKKSCKPNEPGNPCSAPPQKQLTA